jgi:DMSO reductase anchor subunit
MGKLPSKLKAAVGLLVWLSIAVHLILKRPEYWDAWKGMGIALILTMLTCLVAILLSGHYKQGNGK